MEIISAGFSPYLIYGVVDGGATYSVELSRERSPIPDLFGVEIEPNTDAGYINALNLAMDLYGSRYVLDELFYYYYSDEGLYLSDDVVIDFQGGLEPFSDGNDGGGSFGFIDIDDGFGGTFQLSKSDYISFLSDSSFAIVDIYGVGERAVYVSKQTEFNEGAEFFVSGSDFSPIGFLGEDDIFITDFADDSSVIGEVVDVIDGDPNPDPILDDSDFNYLDDVVTDYVNESDKIQSYVSNPSQDSLGLLGQLLDRNNDGQITSDIDLNGDFSLDRNDVSHILLGVAFVSVLLPLVSAKTVAAIGGGAAVSIVLGGIASGFGGGGFEPFGYNVGFSDLNGLDFASLVEKTVDAFQQSRN